MSKPIKRASYIAVRKNLNMKIVVFSAHHCASNSWISQNVSVAKVGSVKSHAHTPQLENSAVIALFVHR